jgi:hypothetical protein
MACLEITDNLGDEVVPEVDRIILPIISSSDVVRQIESNMLSSNSFE